MMLPHRLSSNVLRHYRGRVCWLSCTTSSRNNSQRTDVMNDGPSLVGPISAPLEEYKIWPRTAKLADDLMEGSRLALSRSITLVESSRADHNIQAQLLLERLGTTAASAAGQAAAAQASVKAAATTPQTTDTVEDVDKASASHSDGLPSPPPTFRLGIAGPPGAGKSTFIEALGLHLVENGHRVAVLAIDPSSTLTGGSILGDKTRMGVLSTQEGAYVRPSPNRGRLGGVCLATREAALLCEHAGHDVVIVETVGLGQSEIDVLDAVDCLLLLLPPAAGDELQGSKKGISEVADVIVVNKADGHLRSAARRAASDYTRALALLRGGSGGRHGRDGWKAEVCTCSSVTGEGVEEVWGAVMRCRDALDATGQRARLRVQQEWKGAWRAAEDELLHLFRRSSAVSGAVRELGGGVEGSRSDDEVLRVTSRGAARRLLAAFQNPPAVSPAAQQQQKEEAGGGSSTSA